MLKRFASRLVLNFRIVMLVITSLLLLLGIVGVYNQLNWSEPYIGLIAYEGESQYNLTTDGSGQIERQSKLVQLSPEGLAEGNRQILISLEGRGTMLDGRELVISWSIDPSATRRRLEQILSAGRTRELRQTPAASENGGELLYLIKSDGETVAAWVEHFEDYGALFERIASDIGIGGRLDVTYQPHYPAQSDFEPASLSIVARRQFTPITFYLRVAVGFLFLPVGFLVYFSGTRRSVPHATHFFLICLALFVSLTYQFTTSGAPFAWIIFWFDKVAFLLTPALLVHFFYLFSRDRFDRPWSRRIILLYLPVLLLLLTNVWLLNVGALPFGAGPTRVASNAEFYSLLRKIEVVFYSVLIITGLAILWRAFRATESVEKKIQLKWLFWGVGLGLLPQVFISYPFFLLDLPTDAVNIVVSIPLFVLPVCFAFAVFRYKLMDVEVVFKRGFVYFISSFSVIALYLLIMLGLGLFGGSLGNTELVVISGIMVMLATLFSHRIKDQVQSIFDRMLYSDFYQFRRTLQRFSQELSYERDLSRLLAKIAGRVKETFAVDVVLIFIISPSRQHYHLSFASREGSPVRYIGEETSTWLRERFKQGATLPLEGIDNEAVANAFRGSGVSTLIPFLSLGEVIGFMALGNKEDGDVLNSDDLDLLSSLASRAAASIDNAMLYLDLQRRAEEFRKLKEFSDSIVESIDTGICVVNPEGMVQRWNTALENLCGVESKDALGRPLTELLPPELLNHLSPYIEGSGSDSGEISSLYKLRITDLHGRERVLNVSYAPLGGIEGQQSDGSSGTVFIIDDVTDWVSMEEQMLQRDRLSSLGLLAAGVAHEVNTPLTGISSYTQIVARRFAADEEAGRLLGKIEDQAHRASRIINNLLSFSRVGKREFERLDLNNLIKETLTLVENQITSPGVRVTTELEPYLSKIVGDRGRLQQVLINLLLNARDSMQTGGEIRISTSNDDDWVVCAVADDGVGIHPDNIGRIYDPFFTTKKTGKGTGLGLSVSYGIIQEHSGEIEVESEVGSGTIFRVRLPATPSEDGEQDTRLED